DAGLRLAQQDHSGVDGVLHATSEEKRSAILDYATEMKTLDPGQALPDSLSPGTKAEVETQVRRLSKRRAQRKTMRENMSNKTSSSTANNNNNKLQQEVDERTAKTTFDHHLDDQTRQQKPKGKPRTDSAKGEAETQGSGALTLNANILMSQETPEKPKEQRKPPPKNNKCTLFSDDEEEEEKHQSESEKCALFADEGAEVGDTKANGSGKTHQPKPLNGQKNTAIASSADERDNSTTVGRAEGGDTSSGLDVDGSSGERANPIISPVRFRKLLDAAPAVPIQKARPRPSTVEIMERPQAAQEEKKKDEKRENMTVSVAQPVPEPEPTT
ncbi:unnamed protein product, partial [Amoebophrya sp. A25]